MANLNLSRSIFREYDVRGVNEVDLSEPIAELLGRAYAMLLRELAPNKTSYRVSVGRDCRVSGERYSEALIRGLTCSGLNVVRLGMVPTPVTYYSAHHLNLDGAIMVTGSHNPPEYNGFKIGVGKGTLHGDQIQRLFFLMESLNRSALVDAPKKGSVENYDILSAYLDELVTNAGKIKRLSIVLDAGNGMASVTAPALFKRIGAQVKELYCTADGTFPNHHPDPTVPENLKDLIAEVKKTGADMGFAFDGDADRIGLVDQNGRIVYGDELMVILARAVLKEKPGATIISEVKSSHRLYQDIEAKGGKPIMYKTGHSLIKAKMKETGAALAGEMSGHVFFADRYYGFDDAVYAALRLYEIAAKHGKPVSTLIEDLDPVFATPEIRVDCEESKKFKLVAEVKTLLAKKHKVNDIDGVRLDFSDGWGLVRASNTQPVLVLRYEATSESRLKEIRALIEGALSDAAKSIGHPKIVISQKGSGHH